MMRAKKGLPPVRQTLLTDGLFNRLLYTAPPWIGAQYCANAHFDCTLLCTLLYTTVRNIAVVPFVVRGLPT